METPDANLLPQADSVIRRILPDMLEAEGMDAQAEFLRALPELMDGESAAVALGVMERIKDGNRHVERLEQVGDVMFLCQEAVCAAARGDARGFSDSVRSASAVIRRDFPSSPMN